MSASRAIHREWEDATTQQGSEQPIGAEWLLRMAELEDACGVVSVGGFALELSMLRGARDCVPCSGGSSG